MKLICFVLGCSLLVFVTFTYEDEEKRVGSWLDDIWISLSDLEGTMTGRVLGFLRSIAAATVWLLRKLYGTEIFSIRAFVTSLMMCAAVGCLMEQVTVIARWEELTTGFQVANGILLAGFIGTLSLCFIFPNRISRNLFTIYALGLLFFSLLSVDDIAGAWAIRAPFICVSLCTSSTIDFLCTASTRWAMKNAAKSTSLVVAAALFALCIANALVVYLGPMWTLFLPIYGPHPKIDPLSAIPTMWFFNAAAFAVCLAFSLVAISSILFRLAWLLLPRAFYAVIKLKIANNRKAATSLGIVLVGLAFPHLGEMLKKLVGSIF